MKVLIVAEHNNKKLSHATLHVIGAARKLNREIHLLVAGYQCSSVIDQAQKIAALNEIYVADDVCYQYQLAENIALLVKSMLNNGQSDYSHLLAAASTTGKNLLPRVAALCDVEQISDVIAIESQNIFKRPVYAGNAVATVESTAELHVATLRIAAFEAVMAGSASCEHIRIVQVDKVCDAGLSEFVSEKHIESERPDLTSAEVVVSGGRGMGSADNFDLLYQLADRLNAAVGATRAAVDAGFAANEMQVGQTGKIIAPQLYIAVGLSGAIQHLAGMKDSKVIVAINKDENAPIFEVADYAIVADLFEALPELTRKV